MDDAPTEGQPTASTAIRAQRPAADRAGETAAASERIVGLIGQLNADNFSAREAALQKLVAEGRAVIDPVAAAVGAGNPEIDWRGVAVLKELMGSEDMGTVMQAELALDQIIEQSLQPTLSRMANEALEEQRKFQHPRAVSAIEALGGVVKVTEQSDGTMSTTVELNDQWKGGDKGMWHLRRLMNLQSLTLTNAPITDQGLSLLGSKITITNLVLVDTPITDEGLGFIARLSNLQVLKTSNTRITDQGLPHLRQLTNLKELHLCGAQITSAGVRQLKGLSVLEQLLLTDTDVDDASLEFLASLPRLRGLDLEGTKVTDRGMHYLQTCKRLHWLGLSRTKLTKEGVREISKISSLSRVYLTGVCVDVDSKELRRILGEQKMLVRYDPNAPR